MVKCPGTQEQWYLEPRLSFNPQHSADGEEQGILPRAKTTKAEKEQRGQRGPWVQKVQHAEHLGPQTVKTASEQMAPPQLTVVKNAMACTRVV